eukprot:6194352-Pleurochrysis_carterae.AAC.1
MSCSARTRSGHKRTARYEKRTTISKPKFTQATYHRRTSRASVQPCETDASAGNEVSEVALSHSHQRALNTGQVKLRQSEQRKASTYGTRESSTRKHNERGNCASFACTSNSRTRAQVAALSQRPGRGWDSVSSAESRRPYVFACTCSSPGAAWETSVPVTHTLSARPLPPPSTVPPSTPSSATAPNVACARRGSAPRAESCGVPLAMAGACGCDGADSRECGCAWALASTASPFAKRGAQAREGE